MKMAKLSAAQLKALPDSMFGLPETRQYPMPDKEHVIKAIQFFKYCPNKKKPELAKNINRRAKELKMKVKVQTTSAFYKYADKSILKEAYIIQEFHIGQLSPIVPLQPEIINKPSFSKDTDTEAPMVRLQRLWNDEKKSLDEKNSETLAIATDCANKHIPFTNDMMYNFHSITELNDMLFDYSSFKSISSPVLEDFLNSQARRYDSDALAYNALLRTPTVNLESLVDTARSIERKDLKAAAISYVNYNSSITPENKEIFNKKIQEKIPKDVRPELLVPDKSVFKETPKEINIHDNDKFIINNFLEAIKDGHKVSTIFSNLVKFVFPDVKDDVWEQTPPELEALFMEEYMDNRPERGYTQINSHDNTFTFLKTDNKYYLCKAVIKTNGTRFIFLLKINDKDDDMGYNTDIITYLLGTKRAAFKPIYNTIQLKRTKTAKLEAADFKDTLNGIQISNNGNVSLLFDFGKSWSEKVNLCKAELAKNKKDENLVALKSNLCFLFSIIAYINKVYIRENNATIDKGGYDYTDAMKANGDATENFKEYIMYLGKKDPKFIFVNFYNTIQYNDKLHVFDETGNALYQIISLTYTMAMK